MDQKIGRRGLLFLASAGLLEAACGPIATPTPRLTPRPISVAPTLAPAGEITRGVPIPAKEPIPTPISAERVKMVLDTIGARATKLAQQSPEYFIDIIGMEGDINSFLRRDEIKPNSAIAPHTFMGIVPGLPLDRLTGAFANPRAEIHLHPDFFSFPTDDQVLGMTEAIGARQIHIDSMRRLVGRLPDKNSLLELAGYLMFEKVDQRPELYFGICGMLDALKGMNPSYKSNSQRLIYERLVLNNGQDSLYSTYRRVSADTEPAKRTSQNPIWKDAIRAVFDS